MLKSKEAIVKRIIFIILAILLVIGAASAGYTLTQRYKGTITTAYNDFLDNISGKIANFQDDILRETSELKEIKNYY